jgi:hypothetical protein
MNTVVSCSKFTQFLVDQQPVYDKLILADIRPTDGWIGHVKTGTFEAYSGIEHTLDRFNHVFPDITKKWSRTVDASCVGTPCDKTEYCIGWGSTRITYYLEEQSWSTPLLCFDQLMHITKAREQFRQIISDILKPATSVIMSNFLRRRAVTLGTKKKWVANSTQTDFNPTWVAVGDSELYLDVDAEPTSKLTPQMLQRRVSPLMLLGYFGKTPFKDQIPGIELVTDMETLWDLQHLACNTNLQSQWRFTEFESANKFWRYGFAGQIGNYYARVDPFQLRFNRVGIVAGKIRFQVVLPYKNIVSSGAGGDPGLKSDANDDYQKARYAMSFIWHKMSMEALVSEATAVNPEMPFSSRNFGGKWQFVMDNLGADASGCVIENKRRNKGQFIGDFKLAIRPMYTELSESIFHMREPACQITCAPCNSDPGYPTQSYNSCNSACA